LGQVLGSLVGGGPLVRNVLWVEFLWFLVLLFILVLLFWLGNWVSVFVELWFFLLWLSLWLELDPLDLVVFSVLFLVLVLETNDGNDFSNVLLSEKELIHVSLLKSVLIVGKLSIVDHTFKQDVLLRGSLGVDNFLNHFNDMVWSEVRGREVDFLELISNFSFHFEFSSSLVLLKFLAQLRLRLNFSSDSLINRDVKHAVFDRQVSASSVNTKVFLVINQDNLWDKNVREILDSKFKRTAAVQLADVYSSFLSCISSLELSLDVFCFCFLLLQFLGGFFPNLFSFILFLESIVNLLFFGITVNNEIWGSQFLKELNKLIGLFVSKSIEDISDLGATLLVRLYSVENVFLDLLVSNISFKWLIFSAELLLDVFNDLFHVNDLVTHKLLDLGANLRFSRKGSSMDDSEINFVS